MHLTHALRQQRGGTYHTRMGDPDGIAPQLLRALFSALLASGLAFGLMWRWFWTRLQGFTGDCLGTTQQLCELAFYLGLAVSL